MRRVIFQIAAVFILASFCYAADTQIKDLTDGSGSVAGSWKVVCDNGTTTYICTANSLLALKIGTVTNAQICAGDSSGKIQCTTDPNTWAALGQSNTFTENNTFGNADTDTLTLRSLLVGGNSRAVWIAGSAPTPSYATGTNELYVGGDIESGGNVYAANFISTGTGESYISFGNNSSGRSPTAGAYEMYVDTGVFKLNQAGTEYSIPLGPTAGQISFTGPSAARSFTLPDADSTILVSGGALGTPSSGTLTNATGLPISGLVASTSTALGVGSIELGHASDTTIARSGAGAVTIEGVAVVTESSTNTLTNKTIDGQGTGNVIKDWGYMVFTHPHLCASGAPMQTTNTSNTFGQCKFGNATDKATNYAEYYTVVPPDIDTGTDLTATFKFKLGGADTGDFEYEISFDSVANSASYAGSLGDAISLAYTADASGADGDVETAGETTLTGWRSAMTAGQLMVIRLARDGDHANDTSTVDSYSGPLVIKYKKKSQ